MIRQPQPQAADEQEGAWWDAHGEILGDMLQDEAAIEAAPAIAVGYVRRDGITLNIFRAQRDLACFQCDAVIAAGALFSRRLFDRGMDMCEMCQPTARKKGRAA